VEGPWEDLDDGGGGLGFGGANGAEDGFDGVAVYGGDGVVALLGSVEDFLGLVVGEGGHGCFAVRALVGVVKKFMDEEVIDIDASRVNVGEKDICFYCSTSLLTGVNMTLGKSRYLFYRSEPAFERGGMDDVDFHASAKKKPLPEN
jgi:hypothetical protein